jgi:hypothetical protein
MKSKIKSYSEFNLNPKQEYFIRSSGKNEFKVYVLINKETFDQVDMFFQTEDDAREFAKKKDWKIVDYKED